VVMLRAFSTSESDEVLTPYEASRSCEYSRKMRSSRSPDRVIFETIGSPFSVRTIRSV